MKDDGRRGTFARQVGDALAHLYDPLYLQTHPLAHRVPPDRDPRLSGVGYQILHLRYVEAMDVPTIQSRLALGKSEYYREQQRALDAVVSLLWDQTHVSVDSTLAARQAQFPPAMSLAALPVACPNDDPRPPPTGGLRQALLS